MTRNQFIQHLADFLDTFPAGCSSYHTCDVLFKYAERHGLISVDFDEEDDEELDFSVTDDPFYGDEFYCDDEVE